jgi:hypothetical protein
MPRRLDVRKGHPILLDGRPLNSSLARIEPRSEPFPLFLWDGRERLYDVDLYEEGKLVGTVPPKSIFLDSVYDRVEAVWRDAKVHPNPGFEGEPPPRWQDR